jgi:NAD(P)-dependent dehydrogenase (short-subunit alcohol dehydrogenase family)
MNLALITGAAGGIGSALVSEFIDAGYEVIATDKVAPPAGTHRVAIDLARFAAEAEYRTETGRGLLSLVGGRGLQVLVNNAASQVVGPFETLGPEALRTSLDVNVAAPFLLAQTLLPALEQARGLVLNVGSIHATLTKPGFTAYATSKAALHGFTRALAVELGGRARVNAIAPAAVDTPMLQAGFAGDPRGLDALRAYHPAGEIGTPGQVARLAVFLAGETATFATGMIIPLDGGIGSRLHDPA